MAVHQAEGIAGAKAWPWDGRDRQLVPRVVPAQLSCHLARVSAYCILQPAGYPGQHSPIRQAGPSPEGLE